MKKITYDIISEMERIPRMNLINSVLGFKPALLVGSCNKNGETNLAIFSSFMHISSDPPQVAIMIRPHTIARHTYENILETGALTLNHIHPEMIQQAHQTSAKYERDESEFEATGLQTEFLDDFKAPFVQESRVKMACSFVEEHLVSTNKAIIAITQIESLYITDKQAFMPDNTLDLYRLESVTVNGLYNYGLPASLDTFAYAKRDEPTHKKFK